MYLKEAFRYQNFLNGLFERTAIYLSDNRNITKTTQEHMRSKVNPDAEDETVDMSTERQVEYEANDLISFMEHLIKEKEQLSSAISKAKIGCDIDIDAEVSNNKLRQRAAEILSRMGHLRPSERIVKTYGYKFNAEGNQVQYTYDVKEVSVIDFDRNKVKGLSKSLTSKADEVSAKIDRAMVELLVEYEPTYSVNDSYEDVMEAFLDR